MLYRVSVFQKGSDFNEQIMLLSVSVYKALLRVPIAAVSGFFLISQKTYALKIALVA
jgi:hypothetical protein